METTIRPETPADYGAITEVNEQAFGRPVEARLVEALRQAPEFIDELSLVVERDGLIIGHVLLSPVQIQEHPDVKALGLGPVAVRPEMQRQGIGGQLIQSALKRGAELGYQAVILVGHPTYYPRFGFKPASTYGLQYTSPVPDDIFMALPLTPGGLEGVQGTVFFPPAFAAAE